MEYKYEIQILIDEIESARIIAGAIFGSYANDSDYDRAVIFQMIRDTLEQQKIALENLIVVHRED